MKIEASDRWWDDDAFQDSMVGLLCRDYRTLKECAPLLSAEDFRPQKGSKDGRARWIVAERALEYFAKYKEPIGKMLRSDVLLYSSELAFGSAQIGELKAYIAKLDKIKSESPDALVGKVIKFKSQRLKADAISELVDLQAAGGLTDEKWHEISKKALAASRSGIETTDYMRTLDSRIDRRANSLRANKIPWTFIDPLDAMVRCVGRKQLGMVMAPYKRGKSTFLLWLACAYALQRLRVLYVTLEDPQDVVEDRLDSIITHVALKDLTDKPKTTRRNFERRRRTTGMSNGGIEIYDGTEGGTSVETIDQIVGVMRDDGAPPDAILVDYDEEITPSQKFKEKRFETDDVYRGLRRLNSRHNTIGWTAAQTQRNTRALKILSGDLVAEDIGKMRKVTVGLSLGKGDWSDNGYYLWVAAHKNDKMEVGCELVPDLDRALVYDREATRKAQKEHAADI